ncbi:hypothetical protein OBE_08916, partial [human gut metagenome]
MPRVSKEQIHAANRMTAIEFLRRYRPGSLVKSSARGEYQLAEHDSLQNQRRIQCVALEKPR